MAEYKSLHNVCFVFSVYFIFTLYGSYECHALTFLSSFYLMLLSTCILLCANKHGWMDNQNLVEKKVFNLMSQRQTTDLTVEHRAMNTTAVIFIRL